MTMRRQTLTTLGIVFIFAFCFSASFVSTAVAGDVVCCLKPPDEHCGSCYGYVFVWQDPLECRCEEGPPWNPCPWTYPDCY